MNLLNPFKSKTLFFGYLLTILGVLQTTLPQFQAALSPATYGIATAGVGFIVIVLRALTSQPLSDK